MPQKQDAILPVVLNTDVAFEKLAKSDSPFIKGVGIDLNGNPNIGIGSANPSGEGQNMLKLTKTRSNVAIPNVLLPAVGNNKNIGSFESEDTQDTFCFNHNDRSFHGIYVFEGNTGLWKTVIVDPKLAFSDKQEAYICQLRCRMRITIGNDGEIIEKTLVWTDGNVWQGYINVIAAIKTNGFDPINPYWALFQPHFDREELFQYATRKIMFRPEVKLLANTPSDAGKLNELINTAFQYAVVPQNTDGRYTDFSPYSLPVYVKTEEFLTNPDSFPKNVEITLYAGSCMTEKLHLYLRQSKKQVTGISDLVEWSEWFKYDTIEKFTDCGVNDPSIIGNDYWLRKNPWSDNNYDPVQNTIKYIFDNSKQSQLLLNEDPSMLQNGLALRSKAISDLNDAILFANNEFDYNNLPCETTGNLDAVVKEKDSSFCIIPSRKIALYAYIGQMGDDFSWYSQIGFYDGADTQMRFGTMYMNPQNFGVDFNGSQAKEFGLDLADKTALLCYLKGTSYYSIGKWYVANQDNTITAVPNLLDSTLASSSTFVKGVFQSGGYFICKFEFDVPAGRYNAALGRHSIPTSGDFRNTSTYVMGIANSRTRSNFGVTTVLNPGTALVNYSKEMEVDCTTADVDTWGNGSDLFYIFTPHVTFRGNRHFRFIEGYLHESRSNPLPVEQFPYSLDHNTAPDAYGRITDKNGHYFAYTKRDSADVIDIIFTCKLNCQYPFSFVVGVATGGSGWKDGNKGYITDHNGGLVGDCNRILVNGRITNLDGTIGYGSVGISIVNGSTVFTKEDGTFQLVVHNGKNTLRSDNIYINPGGNFVMTVTGCGYMPLLNFNEALVICVNCQPRIYPAPFNIGVIIQGNTQTSLKEGGNYSIGFSVADLSGRMTYIQVIKQIRVPSFLERNNLLATYLQIVINAALRLTRNMPEARWITPWISKDINSLRYTQWVGDSIAYIDSNGNVITDSSSAVFVSITINSLYDYNVKRNFSTLANYQFSFGDRIKILDDGDGHLFDTNTYASQINLPILGQNYNQAAITAGLIPTTSQVPVINNNINTTAAQTAQNTSITLLVSYDPRLDKLFGKNGFWIELYTPSQVEDIIPYIEAGKTLPVIGGEIADQYNGLINGVPQFNFPTTINIDFWDTYYLQRTITIKNVGNKFFAHPFESRHISDTFGSNITSGGRLGNVKNDNAKRSWFRDDTQKSDDFVKDGLLNGLGTFRSTNKKSFSSYPWGGIMLVVTQRNIILFICENDYFTTDYNFHYSYANAQGIMVTNLNEGLSTPHQKIGSNYGLAAQDLSAVVKVDKTVVWYDRKNEGVIECDYRSARNICITDKENGTQGYMESYFKEKTNFVTTWNNNNPLNKCFDVNMGVDPNNGNILVTFRPRRDNTNDLRSYVSQSRGIRLDHQETLVYSTRLGRWTKFEGFAPESYGTVRGNATGMQMLSFAAGKPYKHNEGNDSFNKFFGIQTEAVVAGVFNGDSAIIKIFQSHAYDSNPGRWFIDLMYTNFRNSFSYLSINQFKTKENMSYAAILRNMNSYPSIDQAEIFRGMLFDGYRMVGQYLYFRMVDDPETKEEYSELNNMFLLEANSGGNKK